MDGIELTSQNLPTTPNPDPPANDTGASAAPVTVAPHQVELEKPVETTDQGASEEETESATQNLAALLENLQKVADSIHLTDNTKLSITFNEEANLFVYHGIDRQTGEVVRELPPEDFVQMVANFREIAGLVVDQQF